MGNNIIETIRASLKNRKPVGAGYSGSGYLQASVLIPIFMEEGQYKVLFTKRTDKVEHHKGQISFPGGAFDDADASWEETALREAEEEVGISREEVEILGRTDDELAVVSGFIVHPFVGKIPFPYDFRINLHEVDSLIYIPLSVFMDEPSVYKKNFVKVDGYPYHGTNYQYQGHIVWGVTARIMENFVRIIGKINLPEKE
jgi:8-oxo-dGTP pyrophosphatase MutT (NUDIX family)